MPTNFLNRRMDLLHSVDGTTAILKMDSSYPVKLSGIILKIFVATSDWSTDVTKWSLKNFNDEPVSGLADVPITDVYDFAGRVISENIGDVLPYATNRDVFKNGDYVMVVMDMDASKFYLCSQTNFEQFITNVNDTDRLKLFSIEGDELRNDIGYRINMETFEKAWRFDADPTIDNHAFVRHPIDDVVYQLPAKNPEDGELTMLPVAKTESVNINCINSSSSPLIYPTITRGYTDTPELVSYEYNRIQYNGILNDVFVKEFCYTADEIKAMTNVFEYDASTKKISVKKNGPIENYVLYFVDRIFMSGQEDNYYYYFKQNADPKDKGFNTTLPGKVYATQNRYNSVHLIPINRNSLKFSILDNGAGNNERCNGKGFELNFGYNPTNDGQVNGCIVGNWWSGSHNDKCSMWERIDQVTGKADKVNYNITYMTDDLTAKYRNPTYGYNYKNACSSLDTITSKGFYNQDNYYLSLNKTRGLLESFTGVYNNISKMIDFFNNNDQDYGNYIKANTVCGNISGRSYLFTSKSGTTYTDAAEYPVTNVFIAPKNLLDIYSNDTTYGSFKDYSKSLTTDNRKNFINDYHMNWGNIEHTEYLSMLYTLMYNTKSEINTNINTAGTARSKNNFRNSKGQNYLYTISNDLIPSSQSNNNILLSRAHYDITDGTHDYDKLYMAHMISKTVVGSVSPEYKDPDGDNGLNSELVTSRAVIITRDTIKRVKSTIVSSGVTYRHFAFVTNESGALVLNYYIDNTVYPLYVIGPNESGAITKQEATIPNLKRALSATKSTYLYYAREANMSSTTHGEYKEWQIFRLKLCVDSNGFDARWSTTYTSSTAMNVFTNFDYAFTTFAKDIVNVDYIAHQHHAGFGAELENMYDRAWCNLKDYAKSVLQNSSQTTIEAIWQRCVDVVSAYRLYGKGIFDTSYNAGVDSNGESIRKYVEYTDNKNNGFGTFDTIMLSVNMDYVVYRYRKSAMLNYKDFNVSDLLQNDTFMYTDGPAPLLSRVLDDNGQFVYNIDTYLDFISNVYISKNTDNIISNVTSYNGGTVYAPLNPLQLKYLNGIGVREEYYEGRSLYNFFTDMAIYDLAVPKAEQEITKVNTIWQVLFPRDTFKNITGVKEVKDGETTNTVYVNASGVTQTISSPAFIDIGIPDSNRYGFNRTEIYGMSDTGERTVASSKYISKDKLYASIDQTGKRMSASIGISDENGIILNINGIIGDIKVDKLTWEVLLRALSNNKSIDILTDSLTDIKRETNENIISLGQNISDSVTMANNIKPSDTDAEFDTNTNLYKYEKGKGYKSGTITRTADNRGVIVFTSYDGSTTLDKHDSTDPEKWTESTKRSKLRAKRMYVTKDGIVCNKEFFDANDQLTDKSLLKVINTLVSEVNTLKQEVAALKNK